MDRRESTEIAISDDETALYESLSTVPRPNSGSAEDECLESKQKVIHSEPPTMKSEIKVMASLAWPVTVATLARMIIYATDTAFLGHLGTDELAGSSLALVCLSMVSTFVYAPAYSLNQLCSQAIGANNPTLAGNWLQLSVFISFLMVFPAIAILWNVRPILGIFENSPSVLHFAQLFGEYNSLIMWPTVVYMAIRQFHQSLHIVMPATVVSLICVGINIGLNRLLISGFTIGNVHWSGFGFIGSPMASTFSVCFQLLLFLIYAVWWKKYYTQAWNGFTINSLRYDRMASFLAILLPSVIADCTDVWAEQLLTIITGLLETTDVAVMSVCSSVWATAWAIYWGLGLATIIRTGHYMGSGDIESAKLVAKISLCFGFVICGLCAAILIVTRSQIAQLFSSDPKVLNLLDQCLPLVATDFFFLGITFCGSTVLEGLSRNKARGLVFTLSAWLFNVPIVIYVVFYSPLVDHYSPIVLIWIIQPIVSVVRLVVIWWLVVTTDWRQMSIEAQMRAEVDTKLIPKEHDKKELPLLHDCKSENEAMIAPITA